MSLDVIMYHYVRDLEASKYPKIKGLRTQEFLFQINSLRKNHCFIGIKELIRYLTDEHYRLPENAILLTFDDGYRDHYENVFPILQRFGIEGVFFPVAQAVTKGRVLDVNKIHFVLAATQKVGELVECIEAAIGEYANDYKLDSFAEYWRKFAQPFRDDTSGEVVFVKRLLQHALPQALRKTLIDTLFAKHVSADERDFASTLYASVDELKEMHSAGMTMGVHGDSHQWMGEMPSQDQESEILSSLNFLKAIGLQENNWVMAYPYGSYNQSLLSIVERLGCHLAFTTEVGSVSTKQVSPLLIPRRDTNEFPKN